MAVPQAVLTWLQATYPTPRVDSDWLAACVDWLVTESGLQPTQTQEIIRNVELQLLQSDLRDSMVDNTGFPANVGELDNVRLEGPVLCQIAGLTDIGHSAFTLHNTRQTRIDKADMAGLAEAAGDDEALEEEGPIPRYPRSMLRFQLNDGSRTLNAIEYRKLPSLALGETPLGYKVIIKDVLIRRGIAFLEPASVTLKGHKCEELDEFRDVDFARGLRMRLKLPEPEGPQQADARPEDIQQAAPESPHARSSEQQLRPRDRSQRPPSPPPAAQRNPPTKREETIVTSPYFSNRGGSSNVGSHSLGTLSPLTSRSQLSALTDATTAVASTARTMASAENDDLSDDMDFDDEVLEGLEAMERAAMKDTTPSSHALTAAGSSSTVPSSDSAGVPWSSSAASQSGAASAAARAASRPPAAAEVIMIDSDDDEKENHARPPPRGKRRKVPAAKPGFIEISD